MLDVKQMGWNIYNLFNSDLGYLMQILSQY